MAGLEVKLDIRLKMMLEIHQIYAKIRQNKKK